MSKYNWDINRIKEAVRDSINLSETLVRLKIPIQGNNTITLKRILDKNNIDYSHFTGRARQYKKARQTSLIEYLTNSVGISTCKLKKKLFESGIKDNKCEICGISEWNGKPLICQMHHINGNNKDNRIENLQILCPNCHSQTDNYCGSANTPKIKKLCPDCGKPINNTSTRCVLCSRKHMRKVDRPSKEQLEEDIKNFSICEVGRRYKVSDSTIRKWMRYYEDI